MTITFLMLFLLTLNLKYPEALDDIVQPFGLLIKNDNKSIVRCERAMSGDEILITNLYHENFKVPLESLRRIEGCFSFLKRDNLHGLFRLIESARDHVCLMDDRLDAVHATIKENNLLGKHIIRKCEASLYESISDSYVAILEEFQDRIYPPLKEGQECSSYMREVFAKQYVPHWDESFGRLLEKLHAPK